MADRSHENWALVCTPCREAGTTTEFSDRLKLNAIQVHFDLEHPEVEKMAFTTEWRGKGPEPAKSEPNRRQRRAAARQKGRR